MQSTFLPCYGEELVLSQFNGVLGFFLGFLMQMLTLLTVTFTVSLHLPFLMLKCCALCQLMVPLSPEEF
jgi:hypothetical protein